MITAHPQYAQLRPKRRLVPLQSIAYVDHPLFATRDAEAAIEQLRPAAGSATAKQPALPRSPQSSLHRALLRQPPVSRDMECYLFLRMNHCRCRASQLQRRATHRALRQAECLLQEAIEIRNHLVESNQRLVVSIAAGFASAVSPLEDLVAASQLPLMRAVDLFDVSRGYCFSTYATHTVRNHCRRVLSRKAARDRRMSVGLPESFEPGITRDPAEELESIEQSLVRRFFAELIDREKIVVSARFGLGNYDRPHTFQEIGNVLGLSKERARVLTHRAIEKLKQLACQKNLTWLEV